MKVLRGQGIGARGMMVTTKNVFLFFSGLARRKGYVRRRKKKERRGGGLGEPRTTQEVLTVQGTEEGLLLHFLWYVARFPCMAAKRKKGG